MIQSVQTAVFKKPARLKAAWINDRGMVPLESGVDIDSWRTLPVDRHLAGIAGMIKRTLFAAASTKIHRVADHD